MNPSVLAAGPGLEAYLLLAAALFSVGLYGVLTRKNLVAILLSVELMANAANINLVAFSHFGGGILPQTITLFTIALTVAEVAVGLAIVIAVYRTRSDIDADRVASLHG